MTDREKALACLETLDCSRLDYDGWLRVGMALENAGCSAADWERWSARDGKKFHPGECAKKWKSFRGNGSAVTIATLIELCREHGRVPDGIWEFSGNDEGGGFDWNDALTYKPKPDKKWIQESEIPQPAEDWKPMDFARYLELMFQDGERVGIVASAWNKDGRWVPTKGVWDRTAGELRQLIHECNGDLGKVIGDVVPEVGAWVRINPLDGNGCRDENVAAYRHALLESDSDDLATQLGLIREMKIPVSAIVHSGGKSIHALVRVDAKDMAEYRQRVDYLYKVAERYGLTTDEANRNPSRLSRLPGVERNGKPQYLIDGKSGSADWQSWVDYVEDIKDDLPNPVNLSDLFKNPPAHGAEVLHGIIRVGGKLVVAGPSGASKSTGLQQLAICFAEGLPWLDWQCEKCSVLYINLENTEADCVSRFMKIYDAMGVKPENVSAIDAWNLKGHACPLDKLAGKIIRRAEIRKYSVIIVDPIYKCAIGDENDAYDTGRLCNLIDKIAGQLGVAVIYAHHHSKGSQGQKKAMDRASGSGVISRDADALIDIVELEISKERRAALESKVVCEALKAVIAQISKTPEWILDTDGQPAAMMQAAQADFPKHSGALLDAATEAYARAGNMRGLRFEVGKVRSFAHPKGQIRVWLDFPVYRRDEWDLLTDARAAGEEEPWKDKVDGKKKAIKELQGQIREETLAAIEACGGVGIATLAEVAAELQMTERRTRDRITSTGKFFCKGGAIFAKKERKNDTE